MKDNKYKHLNDNNSNEFNWRENVLVKNLPPRAFVNSFTSGFLLSIQKLLTTAMMTDVIRKYKKF